MTAFNNQHSRNHQSGFTLIELAIVMIIVSILLLPLIALYSNYYIGKKITETQGNVAEASNYISTFFSAAGRYPCPADPALPPTDPNYGVEDCTASGSIVTTPGLRNPANSVLIGAVPVTTIRNTIAAVENIRGYFSATGTKDSWDNKLTYAVTSCMTVAGACKFFDGQIGAIDEFGDATAGIDNDAHFAIVSHGRNGAGGYSTFGVMPTPCPAAGIERENCDGDALFTSSLGAYEGGGAGYFDDVAFFLKSSGAGLWSIVTDPVTNAPTNHIRNLNTNNVGINTNTPAEKLDVNGTLRATNRVKVERICTRDGTKCFNVNRISSTTGMLCAGTNVMTGVTNGNADCIAPAYSIPANVNCAPNWISGIRTDGCVICSDGSVQC